MSERGGENDVCEHGVPLVDYCRTCEQVMPSDTAENDAPRKGGGWNYRICRETLDNGDFFFALREVYYDDDGNPNGWTAEPVDFAGDSWKDVANSISLASGCIGTSILDLDTREWIKPGPKSSTRPILPGATERGEQ